MSVTELKKVNEEEWALSVKVFTDNMEDALEKSEGKACDLLNEKKKPENEERLSRYIEKNLRIKVNGKGIDFKLLGYEREEEAIWCYFEGRQKLEGKKLLIEAENSLLYGYLAEQLNIFQVESGGIRKSVKVTNPEKKIRIEFP